MLMLLSLAEARGEGEPFLSPLELLFRELGVRPQPLEQPDGVGGVPVPCATVPAPLQLYDDLARFHVPLPSDP